MKFRVKFTMSSGSEKLLENLGRFDSLVEGIIKDTMAQTLLKAIRQRFEINRERMGNFEENKNPEEPTSPAGVARLAQVRSALSQAHAQRKAFFFQRVAGLLTDSRHIKTIRQGDDIIALMGNIRELDAIKSPSAIRILSNKNSRSPYRILWRQMEFGTGALRKPGPLPFVPTRYTSDKGWWYGPKNSKGSVHFRGTHPGNLLRTQTGLPYSEDALAFTKLFAERINAIFKG